MRLISMDAKDMLIQELQTQLQHNQEMLQRKDNQLERIEAKLHEVASQPEQGQEADQPPDPAAPEEPSK